jgi:hypothetical protein
MVLNADHHVYNRQGNKNYKLGHLSYFNKSVISQQSPIIRKPKKSHRSVHSAHHHRVHKTAKTQRVKTSRSSRTHAHTNTGDRSYRHARTQRKDSSNKYKKNQQIIRSVFNSSPMQLKNRPTPIPPKQAMNILHKMKSHKRRIKTKKKKYQNQTKKSESTNCSSLCLSSKSRAN